jgi:integrase/recombinase XerD
MKAKIKDLPSGVGVGKAVSGRGKKYWRVRLGKRFTGGPVILKDFSKLEEARNWIFGDAQKEKATPGAIINLKEKAGKVAFELSATQLHESAGALKELEKAGMSLTEAIQFAIRHAKPPAGILSVAQAIEEALAEKSKSKRPTYLADLGKRWRRFEHWLPAEKRKAINGVTGLDVRRFLNECRLKPVGERNMLRNLSVLFSWAVNQHHMAENPCLGMTVEESTVKKSAVRILSIEEACRLLHLAATGFKVEAADEREKDLWREKFGAVSLAVPPMDMVPIIVVGCFGGVRPEESAHMTWKMVDFKRKHIDLPAEITKDGDRRIVDMPDNLVEWMLACRKESGALLPVNFRRKRWALSRAMGWKEWPDDILRHSYGSYHLAKHRNAALTAEQMGHKNARMLYAHYREVVKETSAIEEYWKLTPELSGKLTRLEAA